MQYANLIISLCAGQMEMLFRCLATTHDMLKLVLLRGSMGEATWFIFLFVLGDSFSYHLHKKNKMDIILLPCISSLVFHCL